MSTYPGALLWLKIGTRLWVLVKISWGEVQAMEVGEVRLMAWRDGDQLETEGPSELGRMHAM